MPTQVTNYQCPACTGPLHYDGASGKLVCDYCGSAYDVKDIEARYAKKQAAADTAAEGDAKKAARLPRQDSPVWSEAEAEGLNSYSCPTCGAELVCDETTAATTCPYCGNPTVVPGQFSGALKPEFVLPFKMTKDDAVRALRAHYRGKPFLPRTFTAGNHIEEIQGVYVPFWLFDGGAEGEVDYKAANSRTYKDDDYEVTETDHYDVHRGGSIAFEKIPVDASSKMPDDHMDSIEPFDYTQMQPFSTAYLPGYLADKYDVTVDDSRARADRRSRETLENALRETVTGYGTCVTDHTDIRLHRGKVHYALLPVWMLSTKWNGESFLFAMNGQTGKLVGDLPTDRGRYWGTFGAIAGVVTVALTVILQFM